MLNVEWRMVNVKWERCHSACPIQHSTFDIQHYSTFNIRRSVGPALDPTPTRPPVQSAPMTLPRSLDEQLQYLAKGAVDLIDRKDLTAKLQRGKPLTVKVGFDHTAPDIHLGHTVVMRKMKHFQPLGHR